MMHLKKFNESDLNYSITIGNNGNIIPSKISIDNTIYNKAWEEYLPDIVKINYKNNKFKFKKGNIMMHSDMIQITYDNYSGELWGFPDTLEFDLYFIRQSDNKIKIDVDITYGDLMVSEFSIKPPNKVEVIEYTSYKSKMDPSNTEFSIEEKSLKNFITFFNNFKDINLSLNDFNFLKG